MKRKILGQKQRILKEVFSSAKVAQGVLGKLPKREQNQIEKIWDIEHAYYSSALEGSKIDRKEFEELGKAEA